MATIISSHTVFPNESAPKGFLWLSEIDQLVPLRHTPTIYVYKAKGNHNIIERLKNSLSEILVPYYPLAGRLFWKENGRIELELNAKGALLLEAETTKTVSVYGDFSPSDHSTKKLVPIIDYGQPLEEIPLLVVQLTRFQNDEGFAIGVSLSHPLADGSSAIRFINSWAKIARGGTLEPNEIPLLDRTILKFSHPPKEPTFDHVELKPLPLILGRSDTTEETNKKVEAILLRLSSEQVEKLKMKANIESDIRKGCRPYSKFEAIGAHLWRCASKARQLQENQPTVVLFSGDIRIRMIPPLPKYYFGNALSQTAARGYVGEITKNPLGYVARKIREATEVINDEYIRSQIDVIRGKDHLDDARVLFFAAEGKNIPYFGNPNFHLTSWMSMPVYEADFGWGKPFYFGLVRGSPHCTAVIALSPDGNGSVIVYLHFQVAHLDQFKTFFYGDI